MRWSSLSPWLPPSFYGSMETHLFRQTERHLISEAVVVGELWREARLRLGADVNASPRPVGAKDTVYFPIDPVLASGDPILPDLPATAEACVSGNEIARSAGLEVEPLLKRAQRFNLTSVRVTDGQGCIVATTGEQRERSLLHRPEVRAALGGTYDATIRERERSGPLPPITSMQRRGPVRVYIALPLFADAKVIGVVTVSRTVPGVLQNLWFYREPLMGAFLVCLLFTLSISFLFSRTISQPMDDITATARAIAEGTPEQRFSARSFFPAEINALSDSLDKMTEKLNTRTRYIADFAANVSHELKTPISSIRGGVELLSDNMDGMSEVQRRRFLGNIDEATRRMERQVASLLYLARIENTTEVACDLPVVPVLRELVTEAGPQVHLEVRSDPGLLHINDEHFRSAVSNLVDNAVRHGEGKPVDVTVEGVAGRTVIRVADQGKGISEANRDKVFQRFFTTERDSGGTGLGLSIVRAVAEGPWRACRVFDR